MGMAADGSAPAMRPPKWLRRPCGVSFGFGGTLSIFSETSASFAKVVTDEPLVARAQELQGALESHEFANYCATKAASAPTERDADEWQLMEVLCSPEQRPMLLKFLGLHAPAVESPPEQQHAADHQTELAPPPPQGAGVHGVAAAPLQDESDPMALFSALGDATQQQEEQAAAAARAEAEVAAAAAEAAEAAAAAEAEVEAKAAAEAAVNAAAAEQPFASSGPPPISAELARQLNLAMLNGNFKAAVDCCLKAGRVADALVLAASGGPELWTSTRDAYLSSSASPFMSTLTAVVHQDFAKYVAESDLALWKESLALLNT